MTPCILMRLTHEPKNKHYFHSAMKQRNFFVITLLIATAAFFTACDTTPPEPVGPSVVVTGPAADTVFTDSVFVITVSATSGDANLKSISVTENGTAIAVDRLTFDGFTAGSNPSPVVTGGETGFTYEVGITASSAEETNTYAVVIEDVDGLTSTESFDIVTEIEFVATPVTERTMLLLLNQAGPAGQGALDLETGNQSGTSATDTEADLKDMGIDTNLAVDKNWLQKFASFNNAELRVPAAGLVYDEVTTSEGVLAAFDAGQDITETDMVAVDDLFLVKTADGNYYLLKTANINIAPTDNSDSYEFSVKN